MSKTLGIVGSGPSGLVTAKEALEKNFKITIFEKNPSIGGVWNQEFGQSWSTMQTNISRFTTVFSENPWADSDPLFPHSSQVLDYLKKFAEKYSINKHIEFNTDVISIHKDDSNSKWIVETRGSKTKKTSIHEFDYMVIATGIFSKPYFPDFDKTSSNFEGLTIHSQFYNQNKSRMKDKKVVLVGSSFSSSEIATDLVDHAHTVTNVINRPYWIIPKYLPISGNLGKLPVDFVFYKQKSNYSNIEKQRNDPTGANRANYEYFSDICAEQTKIEELRMVLNENEPPKVSISESFIKNVQKGKIKVKQGKISNFNNEGLYFEDGSVETADIVIYCTGYLASLDYFDKNIKEKLEFDEKDQLQPILLHKCTFHPELENIAFVGMYRGPFFGVIELQARWAVRTFSGQVQLPSYEQMIQGVEIERSIRNKQPRPQFPHNYVELANSIAEELGLLPDFQSLKETDPECYKMLWEGVTVPDLYRFNENREVAIETLRKIDEIIAKLKTANN